MSSSRKERTSHALEVEHLRLELLILILDPISTKLISANLETEAFVNSTNSTVYVKRLADYLWPEDTFPKKSEYNERRHIPRFAYLAEAVNERSVSACFFSFA